VSTTTLETSIVENLSTTINETSTILPETSSTISTTIPENFSKPENETSAITTVETTIPMNETITVTTTTITNTTIETTLKTTTTTGLNVTQPILNVELNLPEKVTRGEIFNISTTVTNDGTVDVKNVVLNWNIPEKFEIVSGSSTKDCGTIPVGLFCSAELTIATSVDTKLGNNLIKTVVSYES